MQTFAPSADPAYLVLVVGALFVHACYQLGVSVLTHMSAHTLSRKASVRRLAWLGTSYSLGAITMTTLLLLALVTIPGLAPDAEKPALCSSLPHSLSDLFPLLVSRPYFGITVGATVRSYGCLGQSPATSLTVHIGQNVASKHSY